MSEKVLSKNEWDRFLNFRMFTESGRQNTIARGLIRKFGDRLAADHKERLLYLDKHATSFDVREYIEDNLVEK